MHCPASQEGALAKGMQSLAHAEECNCKEKRDATFLPPKKLPANSRYDTLLLERQKTLGSSDLWEQVKLPEGANEDEWIAIAVIDFFNDLNLLTMALKDCCTRETCPTMRAGLYTFAWCDGVRVKVATKMSAPDYLEHLMTWVEEELNNETFLPVKVGAPFPANYRKGMRVIFKRLFRIYAHAFHSHFKDFVEGEADAHLNYSFKHFIYFVKEFNLIDPAELEPMKELVSLCMEQRVRNKGAIQ